MRSLPARPQHALRINTVSCAAPLPYHCPCRDDVEDLTNAAVKEEAIEVKLRGVAEQWAQEVFTFADHKQRGPVVLKVKGLWLLAAAGGQERWGEESSYSGAASCAAAMSAAYRCASAPL